MLFETIEGVRTLTLDLVSTTALAGLLLLLGYAIRKKLPILERFCIPAPVIGGLLFAILALIFRNTGALSFGVDTTLQTPFMVAFFACVGYGGSFKMLKTGGRALVVFLVMCWTMAVIQNAVGVGLATALGIEPVLGVMAGAVSLVGGHGNAAAFGPMAEKLGVQGATTVAFAAATYGLIMGALLGGPIAKHLLTKFKTPIKSADIGLSSQQLQSLQKQDSKITPVTLMRHMTVIGVFMVLGGLVTQAVKFLDIENFSLPSYVGAMFIAIIFRNLNDKFPIVKIETDSIELIKEIGLGFFLTMAIMTLKIWELAELAIPLIIILVVQTILMFLYVRFLMWPALKKDYDAAVMISGFVGAGLGVTATAVADMSAVCEHYKENSAKAFLIVPLCCAVFVDVVAIPAIVFFINYFA